MTPITWYLYGRSGGAKKAAEEIGVKGSASGDIASFSDGADNIPMKSIVAEITPVQSGSGDPSPTNICPISGRTGLTVTAAGKNLIPNIKYQYSENSVYLGENNAEYKLYLPVGTYTLSVEYLNNVHSGAYYRLASDSSNRNIWMSTSTATSGTITIDKDEPFRIWLYHPDGISANNIGNSQIEVGSTATAYEPYHGATYPISWQTQAGTIYGGTLDVVSGVLTVTHAAVDMGTLNYTYDSSGGRFYTSVSGKKNEASDSDMMLAISSMYKPMTATAFQSNPTNGTMRGATTGGYVYFRNNEYTDAASFKTAMAGQTLCYELATPQTYQLTPTEVRTILGGNTIYTDAGSVSVDYIADTKLYIDNKVAELQALILEN